MRSRLPLLLFVATLLAAPTFAQGLTADEKEALGLESSANEQSETRPTQTLSFNLGGSDVLLVPESTNDAVMVLDATSGDPLNLAFVLDATNLSTPINAIADLDGSGILVCDQIADQVVRYGSDGMFESVFAPAGGPDTSVLDNARGCATFGGALHVSIGGGGNDDAIASFDASGAYIGNVIANGAGGLDSPFDFLVRASDFLVPGINSDAIHRYDHAGTSLGLFTPGSFPFIEQMQELASGNVVAADFTDSGVYEFLADGTPVGFYSWGGLGGLRGVYELPSGNFLITNGAGVHEVTRAGAIVRTVVASVSARFIERVSASVIPVELGSFDATLDGQSVALAWNTYSETNNAGFEVQMAQDGSWTTHGFVSGAGTTTEAQTYAYRVNGLNAGTYQFRLKQIDFDGASVVTGALEVTVGVPGTHQLSDAYPNPFNPTTSFTLAVSNTQQVAVSVYDVTGRRVAMLFDGALDAGTTRTFSFDAQGLPSGMYAVRVQGETFQETRSITLLK